MSRLPQTNPDFSREPSQDKYSQYSDPASFNISTYPYNNRYIQGEPHYSSHTIPVVISPHEMHRIPHPTPGVRPSRRDPEYIKRPRRRAEEVDRLYSCTWPGCDKSYGALNHLNTHVRNAGHGPKREPKGKSLIDNADCLEFQEIRREIKAKQARQREQKNASVYRHSGNSVYRTPQYSVGTTSHEYSQAHAVRFDAQAVATYEPSPAPPTRYQPYPIHTTSSRSRFETTERTWAEISQDWRPSSPALVPASTRWSPDNFHDLHTRHPSFAKDLLSQTNFREAALSPRDIALTWNDDRHDSTNYASYIQGPNGPANPRDPYHHYGRKEF